MIRVGPFFLLFLVFLTLKLIPDGDGHIIDWSWWWVTAPVWIPMALAGFLLAVGGILTTLARVLESPEQRTRREAAEALREYGRSLRRK